MGIVAIPGIIVAILFFFIKDYKTIELMKDGPKGTKAEERKKIKVAVEKQQSFNALITNYKKNGEIYRCQIEAFPVFNKKGLLVNFIALENAA